MLEIIGLCLAGAGLARFARLRGGRGWPWVVALVAGYLTFTAIAAVLIGTGPTLIVGGAWVGVLFLALPYVLGRGRREQSTWQCPECQFFNDPTTLVCPCGYRLPERTPA